MNKILWIHIARFLIETKKLLLIRCIDIPNNFLLSDFINSVTFFDLAKTGWHVLQESTKSVIVSYANVTFYYRLT